MSVKNNIIQEFESMLEQQSLESISVSAICKACKISRKTFYTYYKDKYDVLDTIFMKDIIIPIRRLMVSASETELSSQSILEKMYRTFLVKKLFYLNAIKSTGQNSFYDLITERIQQMNCEILSPTIKDEIERDYVAYFFASAQANLIRKWFSEDMNVPPKKMAEFYDSLAIKTFENLQRSYFRK